MTTSERALIESEYGEKEKSVRYAKTIVELADILGVNRKTIDRWRKMKGSPKSKPDGRQDISKWRQFIKKNGLKEADTPEDEVLKSRKLLAEVKQAELSLENGFYQQSLMLLQEVEDVEPYLYELYLVRGHALKLLARYEEAGRFPLPQTL